MDIATPTAPITLPESQELLSPDGRQLSLSSFAGAHVLAVVFISNGCPTVRAYEDRLADIQERYADRGVQLVAVNANNSHLSPGDAHEEMVRRAEDRRFPFPYLKDEDGALAQSLGAVCTPHVFLFDEVRSLRYQGRIDDARDPSRVTTSDLEDAVRALLEDRPVTNRVTEPFGCSIVW
jgi:thiol-disulfide isomerase/thioredoxin